MLISLKNKCLYPIVSHWGHIIVNLRKVAWFLSRVTKYGCPCTTIVGGVTTYIAKTKLAACSDRGLIEQGKGRGRLQPKKIVSDYPRHKNVSTHATGWVIPIKAYRTSRGFPLSSNAGEMSKAARIDATPSQVDNSAILPRALPERRGTFSTLHSRPTSCADAPPPKSKCTDFTGIHLWDMVFSCEEAVRGKIIRVYINPRVVEH